MEATSGHPLADLAEHEHRRRPVLSTAQVKALLAERTGSSSGLAAPVGRYIREHLLDLLAVLIALAAFLQDRAEYTHPEPPPGVTVVAPQPDAGEIARQVDERLREREQQHQAEHTAPDPAPDPDVHEQDGPGG